MAKILVVDDDNSVCQVVQDALEDDGHEVETACNEKEAALRIKNKCYDVVIADMVMQHEEGGLEVLRTAKTKDQLTQVIVLTAYGSIANSVKAMEAGAFTYLEKSGKGPEELALLRRQVELASRYRSGLYLASDSLTKSIEEAAHVLASVVSAIENCSALLATASRSRKNLISYKRSEQIVDK